MAIAIANARRPIVRHKAAWSDDWTELERGSYELGKPAAGLSSAFGSLTITTFRTTAYNREADAPDEPGLDVDHFVQVGAEDPEADPTSDDAIRWLWLGQVMSHSYDHQGTEITGTEQSLIVKRTWSCEGLASLFNRITVGRCLLRAHNGSVVTLERPLVFNADGLPNRSTTLSGSVYPFRLDQSSVGRWTARQAIEHLLACHLGTTRFPDWPEFQLAGQVELLDYVDTWDFTGLKLAEILTTLAGGPRGGSWSIEPDDSGTGTVSIRITSSLVSPVTIAATDELAAVALPASDRVIDLFDTGDSHFQVTSTINERGRSWALAGTVRTTCTLAFRPGTTTAYDGLVRGWASADDGQAGSSDARYADVYRRLVLDPAWNGLVSASVGIGTSIDRDGAGYNGSVLSGGSAPILAARFAPDLVIAERAANAAGTSPVSLATWATDTTATMPKGLPRDQARLYYTPNGTTYYDITSDYQLTITNDPVPTVLIGRDADDAARLKTQLGTSSSRALFVTLTVIDPVPLLVSREPTTPAADIRIRTDHELHQVLAGTLVGVTGTTRALAATTRTIRDDRPAMRSLLAQLAPYLDRAGSATIIDRLHLLALDDCRPGTLVRAYDDGRGIPIDLRAVIAGVTWDFAKGSYGTTLTLEALSLDLRAYL